MQRSESHQNYQYDRVLHHLVEIGKGECMGGVGTGVYICLCETMEELEDQRKVVFVMELGNTVGWGMLH
jgi:hypothetical protein